MGCPGRWGAVASLVRHIVAGPALPRASCLITSPILALTPATPAAQGADVGKIHVSSRADADGWSSLWPPSVLTLVSAC